MILAICGLYGLHIVVIILLLTLCRRRINAKDNEYFTDYQHKNMVLRVFKPEFEFQAIGNIQQGKLLDRGVLSKFYFWALIEL